MRVYDPRVGRFLSVDPLTKGFPWYTPYQFAWNTPIQAIDLDGNEELHYTMTLNKNGSTTLKLTDIKFFYEKNWFTRIMGVFDLHNSEDKLRIPERAVVHYDNKDYYIGFSGSKGRGNENSMSLFKSMRRNMDANFFVENFLNEDQSYSVEAFSTAVHIQDNTALYGPLTEKAWYSNGKAPRGTLKFAAKVSPQKQAKHLEETAPVGKSYLNSADDARKVLDAYNKCQYVLISEDARADRNTVTIQVSGVTGRYVNSDNPNGLPDVNIPTNVFMIQSPQAPKVVPVNPNKGTY